MTTTTTEAETVMKTFKGNCHCGAIKFSVTIPEVKVYYDCNCSYCFRKGYAWAFVSEIKYEEGKGEDKMKDYEFGPKIYVHKFCPTCGTGIMSKRNAITSGALVGINLRALQGIDILDLEVEKFNSKAIDPQYVPPPFAGSEPTAVIENGKTYYGSCHCGGTTLAMKSKGPSAKKGLAGLDCNCSICYQSGSILTYPHESEITIHTSPSTPLTTYSFGPRTLAHNFCSYCSVYVYIVKKQDVSEESFQARSGAGPGSEKLVLGSDEIKEKMRKWKESKPVNLKVFEGVEWDEIEVKKGNWRDVGEKYVVPE